MKNAAFFFLSIWVAFGVGRAAAAQPSIPALVESESARVVTFFGAPFARPFETKVLADRAAFDTLFSQWEPGVKTECWMVATGASKVLAVLSLERWRDEACEHNPADEEEVRGIVAHELVHVYHAQKNPSRDFVGAEELAWFIEGLAVYASGQLETKHAAAARKALEEGKGPKDLAGAWSGRYRYGVCGSLVAYVDETFGRDATLRLLAATTQAEALKVIGLTEKQFLDNWRLWVMAGKAS